VTTCGEVEAESATTSTSTTATTTRQNDTQPPASVEGTQIARTPATVRSQPLARTGPSTNIGPLIMGAGLLLMLGGFLLAWSSRPA
jgi:LPXTG-motif cell wall-anchored protein